MSIQHRKPSFFVEDGVLIVMVRARTTKQFGYWVILSSSGEKVKYSGLALSVISEKALRKEA
jgi:hypothetical protein